MKDEPSFSFIFSCQELFSFSEKTNVSDPSRSGMQNDIQPFFLNVSVSFAFFRMSKKTFFRNQAARTVLHSAEPVSQMLNDWKQIDFEGITRQALWTFTNEMEDEWELIYDRKQNLFLSSFTCLLGIKSGKGLV